MDWVIMVATVITALTAVALAWENLRLAKSGETQAKASSEQLRLAREQLQQVELARFDAQLPILVPATKVSHFAEIGRQFKDGYDIDSSPLNIGVKNVGPRVALNVRGVVFAPASAHRPHSRHVMRLRIPMAAGTGRGLEENRLPWILHGGLGDDVDIKAVGDDTIGVPPQVLHAPVGAQLRMTLTASDNFARKHLFIYDLSDGDDWHVIQISPVERDLNDISRSEDKPRRA